MSVVRTMSAATALGGATAAYLGRRQLLGRALGIRPPTHPVDVHRNVRVRVAEGVTLGTDVYHPRGAPPGPALLVRTPYGRRGWSGGLSMTLSRRFAERGYRVVSQDVRGRFDSDGGVFEPYVHERNDGAATAAWIADQPWCDGRVVTWGPSYLGYVQWALAADGGPYPTAMVPITTAANLAGPGPEGTVPLDATLRWILLLDAMENPDLGLRARLERIASPTVQNRLLSGGFESIPLSSADDAVIGRPSRAWQMWVEHAGPDATTFDEVNHTAAVGDVTAPVHMVTGWFDLFLVRQLDDYARLVAAGRRPHLTIGPWHHLNPRMQLEGLRVGIEWFDAHVGPAGQAPSGRVREAAVRFFLTGADEWRELSSWPPPSPRRQWHLAAGGMLRAGPAPASAAPTAYRYDPADPTPGIGGALLTITAGSVDNRPLERRPDVVTFTTPPLTTATDVVGVPCVRIHLRASSPSVDVVARLCDVHPDGRSMNVADGHVRLTPAWRTGPATDGAVVEVELSPLGHRFAPGHRIRLQLASAAHPRIARNLGTEEPPYTGTRLRPVDVEIHHDDAHPSLLDLPVPG